MSTDNTLSEDVKSTAIVKYSAVDTPPQACRLRSNTDLNLPPENWLRATDHCRFLKGCWTSTPSDTSSPILASLHMANEFPDCIGEVDVVSNAENIKKLLKMPYSKSQVSMIVHRIGKTLFLDEFDVNMYLLHAAKKEWEWLRSFYLDHVLQSIGIQEKERYLFRKNRSRNYLQSKSMLSKFLYYSVADTASESSSRSQSSHMEDRDAKEEYSSYELPAMHTPPQKEFFIPELEEESENFRNADHNFQRNVIWNFEDIRMLIGTDMPIFGAGIHPCVSLRLRDITKPINILTGLDYWLDNLMCNVPEVMMCYHLDGIVQKYELIKTEDLPKLQNSNFSPKVIKDIAQNVLSFLKSNATKAGHTYWLFKAKDDEVVKLYDLTTLCSDDMDNEERNPVTLPLAMLLYRLARNMKSSGLKKSQRGTIEMLLQSCLSLLDRKKHPQIVTSSHYLLSDLYVPDSLNLTSPNLSSSDSEEEEEEEEENETRETAESDERESATVAITSTVEIKALSLSDKHNTDQAAGMSHDRRFAVGTIEDRCLSALQHAESGLSCIEMENDDDQAASSEDGPLRQRVSDERGKEDEVQARARPFQPIPLHYEPLGQQKQSPKHLCVAPHVRLRRPWKLLYARLLLQKASLSAYVLAHQLVGRSEAGTALCYVRLALRCYEALENIENKGQDAQPGALLFNLLGMAGDLRMLLVHHGSRMKDFYDQYSNFCHFTNLSNCAKAILARKEFSHEWVTRWHAKIEDNLKGSVSCYEEALKTGTATVAEEKAKLRKRLGNVKNEMGVFYLNQGHSVFNETGEVTSAVETSWKLSLSCLEDGIRYFEGMDDDINVALLNSNLGKLMRLYAFSCTSSKDGFKEFSVKERKFYEKAISFYSRALRILGGCAEHHNIKESISWELSTTYFTMATLLQDYAPLSRETREDVEKEINELMHKALKCIDLDTPGARQPVNQYRAATVYHRLGAMYHHSFRNAATDDTRRKQHRTLAETYLKKAVDLFKLLEDANEFLTVQLERIGMTESLVKSATSSSAKTVLFQKLVELAIETEPILGIVAEKLEQQSGSGSQASDADTNGIVELVLLLQERLQFALLNLVKTCSGKSPSRKGQHPRSVAAFKQMYGAALRLPRQLTGKADVDALIRTIVEIKQTLHDLTDSG